MESYKVTIKASVKAELSRIPNRDSARIVERIRSLAVDPRPRGSHKISARGLYRIRQGDYRIAYSIDDQARAVDIFKIRHRKEIYRKI